MALFYEGDWVGFEEEVDHAVDEGEVDCDEQQDGFEEEHLPRSVEVFCHYFVEVDAVLVHGRVDGPVFGEVPAGFGTTLEDDGGVGLGAEVQSYRTEECSHDEGYPCRPAPAEIGLRDEAA